MPRDISNYNIFSSLCAFYNELNHLRPPRRHTRLVYYLFLFIFSSLNVPHKHVCASLLLAHNVACVWKFTTCCFLCTYFYLRTFQASKSKSDFSYTWLSIFPAERSKATWENQFYIVLSITHIYINFHVGSFFSLINQASLFQQFYLMLLVYSTLNLNLGLNGYSCVHTY